MFDSIVNLVVIIILGRVAFCPWDSKKSSLKCTRVYSARLLFFVVAHLDRCKRTPSGTPRSIGLEDHSARYASQLFFYEYTIEPFTLHLQCNSTCLLAYLKIMHQDLLLTKLLMNITLPTLKYVMYISFSETLSLYFFKNCKSTFSYFPIKYCILLSI